MRILHHKSETKRRQSKGKRRTFSDAQTKHRQLRPNHSCQKRQNRKNDQEEHLKAQSKRPRATTNRRREGRDVVWSVGLGEVLAHPERIAILILQVVVLLHATHDVKTIRSIQTKSSDVRTEHVKADLRNLTQPQLIQQFLTNIQSQNHAHWNRESNSKEKRKGGDALRSGNCRFLCVANGGPQRTS